MHTTYPALYKLNCQIFFSIVGGDQARAKRTVIVVYTFIRWLETWFQINAKVGKAGCVNMANTLLEKTPN